MAGQTAGLTPNGVFPEFSALGRPKRGDRVFAPREYRLAGLDQRVGPPVRRLPSRVACELGAFDPGLQVVGADLAAAGIDDHVRNGGNVDLRPS